MSFALTEKQQEATELLAGPATHIMLAGGARSGKTAAEVRATIIRSLKAPKSRHAIFRFRYGHIKQSIMLDTFPTVMRKAFPQVKYELNKSDSYAIMDGDSEIWFAGLDDQARTEKVLGSEYATLMFNECSQIPFQSRNIAITRLSQLVMDKVTKRPLPLKAYYDMNPPDKGHWTYKLFKLKVDPESKQALPDPDNYAFMQLNPRDNQQNLSADYIKTLESLPARLRKRFLEGEFRETAPNALFADETFDRWRLLDGELPEMLRIVVAVDPSGADDEDNVDNDEIGIVVAGLGVDGNAYVLEDLTCKAGPSTWGRIATDAYERHGADRVIAETNFGGAMVRAVIQGARRNTPFRPVSASRGKTVRAEPVSSLCENGKVRMAGIFRDLEDELCGFTTHGYTGDHSPNRADAFVWAMSDLFPELLKHDDKPKEIPQQIVHGRRGSETAWMRNL